jgi:hypothetical protein
MWFYFLPYCAQYVSLTYLYQTYCTPQSTYRGRGEIGGVYLPSQLERILMYRAGFFKQSMGAIGTEQEYGYRVIVPARQATKAGGIHSLESVPGLHKCLKILAQDTYCRLYSDIFLLPILFSQYTRPTQLPPFLSIDQNKFQGVGYFVPLAPRETLMHEKPTYALDMHSCNQAMLYPRIFYKFSNTQCLCF